MFCAKCGTQIEEGGRFCPNCGSAAGGPDAPSDQIYAAREQWIANHMPEEKPKKDYVFRGLVLFVLAVILTGGLWFYVKIIRGGRIAHEAAMENFLNTEGKHVGYRTFDPIEIKGQTLCESNIMTVRATYYGDALDDKVHSERIDLPCEGLFLEVTNRTEVDLEVLCDTIAFNGASSTFAPELKMQAPVGETAEGMVRIFLDSRRMNWRMDMKLVSVENITLELTAKNAKTGTVLEKTGILTVKTKSKRKTSPKCNYESRLNQFYSSDGITLYDCGIAPPYFRDGGAIGIYVENDTNQAIRLDLIGDIDIEGTTVPGAMENAIQAGAKGICYIRLDPGVVKDAFANSPYEREAKATIGIYSLSDDKTPIGTATMKARLWSRE